MLRMQEMANPGFKFQISNFGLRPQLAAIYPIMPLASVII